MATLTLDDVEIGPNWVDLVDTIPSLSGAVALIQNLSINTMQVVYGGGSPAAGRNGIVLRQWDSMRGDATAVWVRSFGASSKISITLV